MAKSTSKVSKKSTASAAPVSKPVSTGVLLNSRLIAKASAIAVIFIFVVAIINVITSSLEYIHIGITWGQLSGASNIGAYIVSGFAIVAAIYLIVVDFLKIKSPNKSTQKAIFHMVVVGLVLIIQALVIVSVLTEIDVIISITQGAVVLEAVLALFLLLKPIKRAFFVIHK